MVDSLELFFSSFFLEGGGVSCASLVCLPECIIMCFSVLSPGDMRVHNL